MFDISKESGVRNSLVLNDFISIGTDSKLNLRDAFILAQSNAQVNLSESSRDAINKSFQFLKSRADQRIPIYGVNTSFGDQVGLIDVNLKNDNYDLYYESINSRQKNIIKSLACSQGQVVSSEIIKVAMMLRAHCLSQGYSGISIQAIESILGFINAGITPVVRCYGSIGASGDLIPLASIAAGIIGENVPVMYQNTLMSAPEAIKLAGLTALQPQLRDGLAMINGTSFMTAITSLALYDLNRLFEQMLSAIAMSLESMLVITSAYHPLVHQLKHHSGSRMVNCYLNNFWKGSELLTDLDELRNAENASKPVQDYYSLRSVPQGFGPMQENIERAVTWIEAEMNSVNDNPIIDIADNKIFHNSNFMGYHVTTACDMLKMDIAQASTWLHALLANMVHARKNHGMPTNLVSNPGQNNGFRSMQLLAAALAVQNRKLATSHQSFMLPTEGDNQDVNSLGTHAAFDLREAVANLERLTAILFLASAQALELRDINKASQRAKEIHGVLRNSSAHVLHCRPMTEDIDAIVTLLKEEKI